MIRSLKQLDPQLRDFFSKFPELQLSDASVPKIREIDSSSIFLNENLPDTVVREQIFIPGFADSPPVRALMYKPLHAKSKCAAYLHMHGGGFVLGAPEKSDAMNIQICQKLDVLVVSIDYRLAPEHPFPAALHDGYAALTYLHENSFALNIDSQRIGVGGESAGAGLAASLCIFARRKQKHQIVHQHLVYPMLDNKTGSEGYPKDAMLGQFLWTRESNRYGWKSYLGAAKAQEAYVPSAERSLEGLPSAWIAVGDLDLFLHENKKYAARLNKAGVATRLRIYPDAPHGFNLVHDADITRAFHTDFFYELANGLST